MHRALPETQKPDWNALPLLLLIYSLTEHASELAAGMNIYAAIFIIPFTVVVYTATGGLKVVTLFPCMLAVRHCQQHVMSVCLQTPIDTISFRSLQLVTGLTSVTCSFCIR